jgi:hypothetical protein
MLVAMLAAPAFAVVDVNCTCDGNEVTVRYNVSSEPNHVRAFALDFLLDNSDANIVSVFGYNPATDDYYIYPGSIDVNADTNNIDDYGSPVANATKYPVGTYQGLDSNAMTIEMASLYYPTGGSSPNAPADSNILLKFIVDPLPVGDTNVIVQLNAKRGGIVMEDGNSPTSTNLSGCTLSDGCFPGGHPDWSIWDSVGQPNCWCGSGRQCHGDGADDVVGDSKLGYWYVGATDLTLLINAWKVKEAPQGPGIDSVTDGICADFAHDIYGDSKLGYWRVGATDLTILINNWKIKEAPQGSGIEPNCLTIYP